MIPSFFEPIGAGITVAIFNKYILNRFDPFAYCYAQRCKTEAEDDDCVSSSSTSVVIDACHVHHFLIKKAWNLNLFIKTSRIYCLKIH